MNMPWQHHTAVAVRRGRVVGRRDFLKQTAALGLAAHGLNWTDVVAARADELRGRGMACILLWMDGAPSQFETWSPLPGHVNGGETKAISTSVPGIQVAANLPHCARVMNELALVRSVTTKEGNHQRATYLLHHGYLPMGGVKHPTLGANVAQHLGDAASELPAFVQIGGRLPNSGGGGLLGIDYDPFILQSASRPPANTTPLADADRYARRLRLLESMERGFAAEGGAQVVADQHKLLRRAADMIHSPRMEAFDLDHEPPALREKYGQGEFAAGCMMARRLVERGVTFVEVALKGWDTHFDNFTRTAELCGQIDQPTAQLVTDLKERGMLDRTLVIWTGEFGRTPRVNPRAGRDHYPRAFSVALAGGGVRGGQVIGAVDKSGADVADRPVSAPDLFRSIYHALGINADFENISSNGRPIKVVDGGAIVSELFG
ncbi:MAG TPA: DUF1501 domain-containing protein [Lacipirellulaceae bacterium]|nr:DUF1501 domain-containing protein [Lacipirellulaceae bacterium]